MRTIYSFAVVIILLSSAALAKDLDLKVTRAELGCSIDGKHNVFADSLQLTFNKSLNADELIACERDEDCKTPREKLASWIRDFLYNVRNYHVVRVSDGRRVFMSGASTSDQVLDNTVVFSLNSPPADGYYVYNVKDAYMLIVKNIDPAKAGDPEKPDEPLPDPLPLMIPITKNSSCELPPGDLPPAEESAEVAELKAWKKRKLDDFFSKAAIEDSPVLKVEFALQGSKRQKMIYDVNVNFRPYTKRRLGLGGYYDLTPFFVDTQYRANAKEGEKKNALNVGVLEVNYTNIFRDDGDEKKNIFLAYVPGFSITITPKLETEWRFKEINWVISPKATLPINLYQSRGTTLQLAPFVGMDFGYKSKSESAKPGWQIQRPFFGAGLVANFLRKEDKPRIAFQFDYIRRILLKPELSYGSNSAGEEVPDRPSKFPREHIRFKTIWNVTEMISPFVELEYGRLPPNYNLLKYSFKTGLSFNGDLVWKAFR